jgi:hypothetical protein
VKGLPAGTWVRNIEASRHAAGTVYAMFDGHQNGDFTNWLFRSTDYGQTWTSVVADLPPSRIPLVLREDLVDPSLIYLGTEFGLFVSTDAAQHWLPFRANLPTVPVNDIALHPRDNALVLGTHGRGIWILDDVRALRHSSTVALAAPVTLAPVSGTVFQQRLAPRLAHNGDMMFHGENPANGITFTVWSSDSGTAAVLAVKAANGAEVWRQAITTRRGATTSTWNLRSLSLPTSPSANGGEDGDTARRAINSAFVRAGSYVATLAVNGREVGRNLFDVRPDRRQDASVATMNAWHVGLDAVATLYRSNAALLARARTANVRARADTVAELQTRIGALYQAMETQVSAPSADMRAQLASYSAVHARLAREVDR